jgi:hypothetical protein
MQSIKTKNMLIAIILAIITFIMGILELYDGFDSFLATMGNMFLHFVLTAVMFFVGCLIAMGIGLYMPKHWEDTQVKLASLKDANGMRGEFVLGTGSIQTSQYYMWYEDTKDGYRPNKVEAGHNVLIKEDSTLHGTGTLVISTRKMNKKSLSHWLVFDVSVWSDQYKFTIPVGSIKKDFNL